MKRILLCVALISGLMSLQAWAMVPGDRVDNFRLLDHRGAAHELRYYGDAKAVVLMVQGNGCPVVRQALPALRELRDTYRTSGVEFLLLNANLQDDRNAIVREAAEFQIDFPVLMDSTQLIGESLGLTRTAEVLVIDPKTWKLTYRGPVDDRLALGAQKPAATQRYVGQVLDAMLKGQSTPVSQVEAVGCLIEFTHAGRKTAAAGVSYTQDVAPILLDKCTACHRPGGIGPWAMTSYTQVRGFAPMIREVIRTRRMPPWHADPHYGNFVGDRSLTAEQARTLVHWIEAGAPRGDGADPLESVTKVTSEWPLGEPDMIVEIPAFDVPSTGVVSYQYPRVANPLDQDVWVRAIDIHPGDRTVVHHVLAGIADTKAQSRSVVEELAAFGGYSPGRNALPFPDGSGVLLRAQAKLLFQVHYTPNGKAVRDVTRVGYYFHKTPPTRELRLKFLMTRSLLIPAGAKSHSETVTQTFDREVELYSLMPHAHLRGKAAKFTARYPDGKEEVLLSVPNYDFNWQTVYLLNQPKTLPAGTQIVFEMTWDNSSRNPANPDPTRDVPWGDQTWDEMNAGWIRYRELSEPERAAQAALQR